MHVQTLTFGPAVFLIRQLQNIDSDTTEYSIIITVNYLSIIFEYCTSGQRHVATEGLGQLPLQFVLFPQKIVAGYGSAPKIVTACKH